MSQRKSILKSEKFMLVFLLVFLASIALLCGYSLSRHNYWIAAWDGVLIILYCVLIYHHFRYAFRRYEMAQELFDSTGRLIDVMKEELDKTILKEAVPTKTPERVRRPRRRDSK